MQKYVQEGCALDLTAPTGGVTGDNPYKIGSIICIATADADEGDTFVGYVEGVYDVPKASGAAWAEGDTVYWDDTAKNFTKTTTSNTKSGYAVSAALSADTEGRIRLVPSI